METEHDLVIIKGKRGSGNTTLAKDLVGEKKAIWTRPKYFSTAIKCLTDDIDFLVIEEVESAKDINKLLPFLKAKSFTILSAGQKPRTIQLPKIIICILSDHQKLLDLNNLNILVKTTF